jgi:5-aminolevulinate synthase
MASIKAIEIAATQGNLQEKFWKNVAYAKRKLLDSGIKIIETNSHIISVVIGCETKVKEIARQMLSNYNIYIQPIFYPTVPLNNAILRITVSPYHAAEEIDYLAQNLAAIMNSST